MRIKTEVEFPIPRKILTSFMLLSLGIPPLFFPDIPFSHFMQTDIDEVDQKLLSITVGQLSCQASASSQSSLLSL